MTELATLLQNLRMAPPNGSRLGTKQFQSQFGGTTTSPRPGLSTTLEKAVNNQQIILGVAIVSAAILVAVAAFVFQQPKNVATTPTSETASPWHRHEDEALAEAKKRSVPDPRRFLRRLVRAVRSDGQQVFSTEAFERKRKTGCFIASTPTTTASKSRRFYKSTKSPACRRSDFDDRTERRCPHSTSTAVLEFTQLSALMDEARDAALR